MSHRLFEALGGQILADLARNNLVRAVPSIDGPKGKQDGLPKSAPPNTGDDMDALLRGIRRYITPKELAELLHWHTETVYRKIKAGMPADRVVDAQGRGRQLKIYPPQVANWLRHCRVSLRCLDQSTSSLPPPYSGAAEPGNVVERRN
jgi:hypothetical protein